MNRFLQLGVNTKGRDFVVGDIHAKYYQLMRAMYDVDFDITKDRLIAVGDLIDRGPDNMLALGLIWEDWFFTVAGNHEYMMAEAINEEHNMEVKLHWIRNGGGWYNTLDQENVHRLKNVYVPHILETVPLALEFTAPNGKLVGVAHADLPRNWRWGQIREHFEALPEGYDQVTQHLLWGRNKVIHGGKEVLGVDLVVHGHTPTKDIVWQGNTVFIDTASYNRYTALQLINIEDLLE